MPALRPVDDADVPAVLDLNESHVEMLAPLDAARLDELRAIADRCDVIDIDGRVGGFVITFGPGAGYDSDNYRWFTKEFGDELYYLDRIVVDPLYRRGGLGTFVYDEIEAVATPHGRLALEVNLVPRNDVSLAFHAARGFHEVGRLGDDTHLVSLMEKRL